jgi:hypothetical protein
VIDEREAPVAAVEWSIEMTNHRSFKLMVRARMAKTGESYTAARATLLAGRPTTAPPIQSQAAEPAGPAVEPGEPPVLVTSDTTIRQRTGRGWEEWFDLLDEAGMADLSHGQIARWVAELLDVAPLAWHAQAVTVSYERARGGRAIGQHADGFSISASRTIAAAPERVFDAFVDQSARRGWLPCLVPALRTSTRPRSARFDWPQADPSGAGTRVHLTVQPKGDGSTITVQHVRLPDQAAATAQKAWWRDRLVTLKAHLEGGNDDA